MNKTTIGVLIAIIILLGLGFWWYSSMQQAPADTMATDMNGVVAGESDEFIDDSKDGAAASNDTLTTVTYTPEGFSPNIVTVKAGQTVIFVNRTPNEMWVGADEHPSHTGYDGTSKDEHCAPGYTGPKPFDQCGVGHSFSYTFTKVGTWAYHNHREDDDRGTVIVTE